MTPKQTEYLQEHFPTKWPLVKILYDNMLRRLETEYQSVYEVKTMQFFHSLRITCVEEDYLDELQIHLQEYLTSNFNDLTRVKQLWWHDLNIIWFGTAFYELHAAFYHVLMPLEAIWQSNLQSCEASDIDITNALLVDLTSTFQGNLDSYISRLDVCENWKSYLPDEYVREVFPHTVHGEFCLKEGDTYLRLDEKLPIFAQRVIQRYKNDVDLAFEPATRIESIESTSTFATTRTIPGTSCTNISGQKCAFVGPASIEHERLDENVVADFLHELCKHDLLIYESLYDTFQDINRSTKKRKAEDDTQKPSGSSALLD